MHKFYPVDWHGFYSDYGNWVCYVNGTTGFGWGPANTPPGWFQGCPYDGGYDWQAEALVEDTQHNLWQAQYLGPERWVSLACTA